MLGADAKTESAVSPVIGVMLLLAIVLILAALVAAFAGGAAETKENAPSMDLAVYTAGKGKDFCLVLEHRGGDLVRIGDLKVNTWVHLPGGDLHPASHEGSNLEDLFGTGVWRAGEARNTGDLAATADLLGVERQKLSDYIMQSVTVDVAVYHPPSGALLHKSSLLLKER
jgi:flagellin-like protein